MPRTGAEALAGAPSSLCLEALIEPWVAREPEAVAITAPGRLPLTYRGLHQFVLETGQALRGMGIGRHERVALVVPNGPEMAVAAVSMAVSVTCVPLDPTYRPDEYARRLARLRPVALVIPAGSDIPAANIGRQLRIRLIELIPRRGAAGLFTLSSEGGAVCAAAVPARPDDVALVLPTSGTTASPKFVPLTHANLCTSARERSRWSRAIAA